jgi:hypothetical protein
VSNSSVSRRRYGTERVHQADQPARDAAHPRGVGVESGFQLAFVDVLNPNHAR